MSRRYLSAFLSGTLIARHVPRATSGATWVASAVADFVQDDGATVLTLKRMVPA
jgi:hypothetical protein